MNNPVLCAKIHRIHNTKDPFCSPQQYFLPLGSTRVSRIEHKKRRKVRSLPPVCHHFATILPPFVQHLPQIDINVPEYHISKYLSVLLINRSPYNILRVFMSPHLRFLVSKPFLYTSEDSNCLSDQKFKLEIIWATMFSQLSQDDTIRDMVQMHS